MVQKGTYTEFLKSGVDFGSLLKKENEEAEQSPAPGTPTLRNRTFSESSVWSQQSSRLSLKDGAQEGQDVSVSPVTTRPGFLGSLEPRELVHSAHGSFTCPKVEPVVPPCSMVLVELNQMKGEPAGLGALLEISAGYAATRFRDLCVAHVESQKPKP
jgi:hypothetical protein